MCTRPSVPRKGRVLLLSGAATKGVNCSGAEFAYVENGTKATRSNTRRYRGVSIAEFYSKSDHRGCPIQAPLGWGLCSSKEKIQGVDLSDYQADPAKQKSPPKRSLDGA